MPSPNVRASPDELILPIYAQTDDAFTPDQYAALVADHDFLVAIIPQFFVHSQQCAYVVFLCRPTARATRGRLNATILFPRPGFIKRTFLYKPTYTTLMPTYSSGTGAVPPSSASGPSDALYLSQLDRLNARIASSNGAIDNEPTVPSPTFGASGASSNSSKRQARIASPTGTSTTESTSAVPSPTFDDPVAPSNSSKRPRADAAASPASSFAPTFHPAEPSPTPVETVTTADVNMSDNEPTDDSDKTYDDDSTTLDQRERDDQCDDDDLDNLECTQPTMLTHQRTLGKHIREHFIALDDKPRLGILHTMLQDVPEEHIPTFNAMAMTVDPPIIHQAVVSWNSNAAPLFNPHANP
jgi:hypothetical protein